MNTNEATRLGEFWRRGLACRFRPSSLSASGSDSTTEPELNSAVGPHETGEVASSALCGDTLTEPSEAGRAGVSVCFSFEGGHGHLDLSLLSKAEATPPLRSLRVFLRSEGPALLGAWNPSKGCYVPVRKIGLSWLPESMTAIPPSVAIPGSRIARLIARVAAAAGQACSVLKVWRGN